MLKIILVATLLLTSLSSVGLISLWAARSPVHWFWRAAVFVAVMSLLLLIPAYEPLVAFSVQGAVVVAGVQLARLRRRKTDGDELRRRRPRFSVLTGLLVTVFMAIAAAVAARLPRLGFESWNNVVLIGVMAGVSTLVGVWVTVDRRHRRWLRGVVGLMTCLGVSLALARSDFFLSSLGDLFSSWPPTAEFRNRVGVTELFLVWSFIAVGIASVQAAVEWLACGPVIVASVISGRPALRVARPSDRMARFASLMLLGALVVPPAFVYFKLLTPLQVPENALTVSKGWTDIVAAGNMAENSPEISTIRSYDTALPVQLERAVKAMAPVYELIDRGLEEKFHCPLEYSIVDLSVSVVSQRSLADALVSRGRLAEAEDRHHDAAYSYLQTIQFGLAVRRGGLMLHSLVGTACSTVGLAHLYRCRANLSFSDCSALISSLGQMEKEAEPTEAFVDRDRIWTQHASGWHGHLLQILDDIETPESERVNSSFLLACDGEVAAMRLLRIELAIQAWRTTSGRLPESLAELVPRHLAEIPVDPMSPHGARLQYRRDGDGYVLYSVGYNGIDDGGAAEPEPFATRTGDLRLDVIFAASP